MNQSYRQEQHQPSVSLMRTNRAATLETLRTQTKEALLNVAYRFFQSDEKALKVVLETYKRFYQKRFRGVAGHDPQIQLWSTFSRLCFKKEVHDGHGRQARRVPSRSLTGLDDNKCFEAIDIPESDVQDHPVDANTWVRKVIAELGPQERMVLILNHWEKKDSTAIGAILHRPVDEVKTILTCARAKCRIKLQPYLIGV